MHLHTATAVLRRFSNDKRGTTATIFALMAVPLAAMAGLSIDYARANSQHERMQQAVDAAVLAAASNTSAPAAADKIAIAQKYFNANFTNEIAPAHATFTVDSTGHVSGLATSRVPMPFASLAQLSDVNVNIDATSTPGTNSQKNVEVAMMIDLTGSMGQTRNGTKKIDALVSAGNDILDILFPTTSGAPAAVKVGIAPMADYVNAGPYAATVTGLAATGAYAKTSNLANTKQGPFAGTYSGLAGSATGNQHGATSASSSTAGATYTNTFCTAGTENETYNGKPVGTEVDDHASGALYAASGFYKKKTENGRVSYEYKDDHYYKPIRASTCTEANDQTGPLITCVTERTGSNAYTDESPLTGGNIGPYNRSASGTSNKVNYSSDGKCNVAGRELPAVIPLTNSKSKLSAFFAGPTGTGPLIGGGTPGHLGHAWAWYMLSPNWSSIWPSASQPADYTDTKTKKYAIIMTDGEYNEQYSSATSKAQALQLCTAMKAKGITVYTVGFGFDTSAVGANTTDGQAKQLLKDCATSASTFFVPYDKDALRTAFQNIGTSIMSANTASASTHETLSN